MKKRGSLKRRGEYGLQRSTYNKKSGADNYRNPNKRVGVL